MACNCATQEKIEEIYKVYGTKMRDTSNLTLFQWCKRIFYFIFGIIMFAVAIPAMLIYVLLSVFWRTDGKVNVDYIDFFKLNKMFKNKIKQCQIAIEHIE